MQELSNKVLELLRRKGLMLATAESCTGGLIAASLTDIAGSSDVVDCGFVTYSNEAKTEMIGVPADIISEHGAVSPQVAELMAEGALQHSKAQVAIACTGIAGPGGGSAEKPVGLVYIGLAVEGWPSISYENHFEGDRASVREQTVKAALQLILDKLDG